MAANYNTFDSDTSPFAVSTLCFCDIGIIEIVVRLLKVLQLCFKNSRYCTQTFSFLLQDPSVLSVTRNTANGAKEFNPFEDQNTSQVSNGNIDYKAVHFPFSRMKA